MSDKLANLPAIKVKSHSSYDDMLTAISDHASAPHRKNDRVIVTTHGAGFRAMEIRTPTGLGQYYKNPTFDNQKRDMLRALGKTDIPKDAKDCIEQEFSERATESLTWNSLNTAVSAAMAKYRQDSQQSQGVTLDQQSQGVTLEQCNSGSRRLNISDLSSLVIPSTSNAATGNLSSQVQQVDMASDGATYDLNGATLTVNANQLLPEAYPNKGYEMAGMKSVPQFGLVGVGRMLISDQPLATDALRKCAPVIVFLDPPAHAAGRRPAVALHHAVNDALDSNCFRRIDSLREQGYTVTNVIAGLNDHQESGNRQSVAVNAEAYAQRIGANFDCFHAKGSKHEWLRADPAAKTVDVGICF